MVVVKVEAPTPINPRWHHWRFQIGGFRSGAQDPPWTNKA